MSSVQDAQAGPLSLGPAALQRLERRLDTAHARARAVGGRLLVSVTQPLAGDHDPAAVVLAARRDGEAWFCLEQPDRDGAALAALGTVWEIAGSGPDRFARAERQWRDVACRALADPAEGPSGSGLVAVGGFAFADEGGRDGQWDGFPPASLLVPEISLARRRGETWLTVNVALGADDDPGALLAAVRERTASLTERPLPLLDPAPVGTFRVRSVMPPSHHEEAVARAVERIRAGELEKVVLAREVRVQAPAPYDPAAIFGVLRDGFPSCFVSAVGRGPATFIGASPELLVRRDGQRASTVALAGSIRRSADPAVDDHLGEQLLRSEKNRHENAIVARRIAHALEPLSVWVTAASEPSLVKVANIQHLGIPIRAQLAAPVGVIELVGALHPTPAVGGEPSVAAQRLIPALEGLDRGWYAGAIGWSDLTGDGEFCVALRCALLRGGTASCFAGGGIVADSDPASELAETETKLGALLPVLSG